VPVLVMHGDDDQIVPYADSATPNPAPSHRACRWCETQDSVK